MRMAARLETALCGIGLELREALAEFLRGDAGDAEFAHARRVDDEAAVFKRQKPRGRCGVPAALALHAELPGRELDAGEEFVEQRRFADAAVPEESGMPSFERLLDRVELDLEMRGCHDAPVAQRFIKPDIEQVDFFRLFPFINDEKGFEVPVMRADEISVDEAGLERRRADARDDDERVQIGDNRLRAALSGLEALHEARARLDGLNHALIIAPLHGLGMNHELDAVARDRPSRAVFLAQKRTGIGLFDGNVVAVISAHKDDRPQNFNNDALFHQR